MNVLKYFPYGSILAGDTTTECAICLEEFTE